jgi:N6-L-threonylcarbamoyladenine synthase
VIVLGIDTSCDDTGVGITEGETVRANVVASQTALHAPFGGVMPEQASREHLAVIGEVVDRALAEAGVGIDAVDAVAATYGPGLVGALLVGLSYAKALAWARGVPFIPVHHLEGHIASALGSPAAPEGRAEPPFLCLIASGGHTSLFEVRAWGDYHELGRTRDDAAGEAFDKAARLLGLGYPGGRALSQLAEAGDPEAFPFPLPLKGQGGFDFSFSGLKTALARLVDASPELNKADLAASFERVVVESLVGTALRAADATGHSTLVVAGGVAANRRLRERLRETPLQVRVPPLSLATDNGAMIALAAYARLKSGLEPTRASLEADAVPYLPLSETSLRATSSPSARS